MKNWKTQIGNILIALREDPSKEFNPEILNNIIEGAINRAVNAARKEFLEGKCNQECKQNNKNCTQVKSYVNNNPKGGEDGGVV